MSKHTKGPWRMDTVYTSSGIVHKIGPFPRSTAVDKIGYACVYVDHPGAGPREEELLANASLMVVAPDMFECLEEARRAIGDHNAPADCYATGPITGDPIRDLVQCPACSFISMHDAVKARIAERAKVPAA